MKWFLGVALAAVCVGATANAQEARAVVDKAIKAMGSENSRSVPKRWERGEVLKAD